MAHGMKLLYSNKHFVANHHNNNKNNCKHKETFSLQIIKKEKIQKNGDRKTKFFENCVRFEQKIHF